MRGFGFYLKNELVEAYAFPALEREHMHLSVAPARKIVRAILDN